MAGGQAAVAASQADRFTSFLWRSPMGSLRGVGDGGLLVLRIGTAGHLTTRRLPGTSRAQSPFTNHLDRPDPEVIPAGFGDS